MVLEYHARTYHMVLEYVHVYSSKDDYDSVQRSG